MHGTIITWIAYTGTVHATIGVKSLVDEFPELFRLCFLGKGKLVIRRTSMILI